jgi:hypothetical protein
MNKTAQAQAGQMMKLAAENLRALSEENQELKTKVSHYEKKARVEKIASSMEAKGLEPELSMEDKIAGLLKREDLSVVEEAVSMSAPQMKLASVHDGDARVAVEGDETGGSAQDAFAANLASID